MSDTKCEICGTGFTFRWLLHHGIGACVYCTAPYQVLIYKGDKRVGYFRFDERIGPPPVLLLKPEYVEAYKQCAAELMGDTPTRLGADVVGPWVDQFVAARTVTINAAVQQSADTRDTEIHHIDMAIDSERGYPGNPTMAAHSARAAHLDRVSDIYAAHGMNVPTDLLGDR